MGKIDADTALLIISNCYCYC